jgi:hypothetical protein
MKQENTMKRKMNQVNPKAGTLKQNKINWSNLKNASRKLIASVMMIAVIAMTPGVLNAGTRMGDTCCTPETSQLVKLVKEVKLTLPSQEMIRKADTEAHRNLVRSLSENKMNTFSAQFAISDADIISSFNKETMISLPVADRVTDENITTLFQAENIDMSSSIANSDSDIMDIFQAENDGIKLNIQAVAADDQININFLAENINLPGAEMISKADAEIQRNLEKDNMIRYASK